MRWTARAEGPVTALPFVSPSLRRLLWLALLASGWTLGLILATAAGAHAEAVPERSGGPAARSESQRPSIFDLLDHSLNGLVRTAEDVPRTLERVVHQPLGDQVRTLTATRGDTPRVLGRPGSAVRSRTAPVPLRRRSSGLPPRERGAAAGHRSSAHGVTVPAEVTADATAARHDQHRTPAPYAPAALVSSTAGPAASSSNAAGPASTFPCTAHPRPLTAISLLASGPSRTPLCAPAREPRHTPD